MKKFKELTKQQQIQDSLLYAIAVVFAVTGIYHGAIGFFSVMDSPLMAWVFMGAIGTGMLLMDFRLKDELESSRKFSKIIQIICIYTLLALVNMLGNFNTFFTKPLKEEMIGKEREALKVDLEKLIGFATDTLRTRTDTRELERKVKSELANLENEITDPHNQGIGGEAETILGRISGYLDNAPIHPPTRGRLGTPEEAHEVYGALKQDILNRLSAKLQDINKSPAVLGLNEHITASKASIQALNLSGSTPHIDDDEEAMKAAASEYNALLGFVRSYVKMGDFSPKSLETASIGKFFYALKTAFSGAYPEAAWLAFLYAFFIDFIVPIIFLTVIGGGGKKEENLRVQLTQLQEKLSGEKARIGKLQETIKSLQAELSKVKEHLTFEN